MAQIPIEISLDAKACPPLTGFYARENLENRNHEGTQMTAIATLLTGAPSTTPRWETIQWSKAVGFVRRLQMRIAKAFREGRRGKVKALQRLLTHSFYAKLIAVKRVSQNKGAKTPGIDNVTWKTSNQKMQAALSLKRKGYKTKPLKRIHIPKKQKGKLRPLSIPVMECRAQQALHLLSLEPISETVADKNAYGFRPLRSTADAISQCFNALAKRTSAQYILEGDIRACFDSISHQWLMDNVPMDKRMLSKWLTAGYIEKNVLHSTTKGTPQGGIISPTLLTVTLRGLEAAVSAVAKSRDKINVCVYADDFIITGATREVLENKVKPIVESFLSERGLSLSSEKTKITHIEDGFDFLGMNIRKYKRKLIISPAKSSVNRLLADIRKITKSNMATKTDILLRLLNPKIRGWANYYSHVCSKDIFNYVDHYIFEAIWSWATRRHPNKNAGWIKQKYFRRDNFRDWIFFTKIKSKDGNITNFDLVEAAKTPIRRHIKIRAEATPYDPAYKGYFDKRLSERKTAQKTKAQRIVTSSGGSLSTCILSRNDGLRKAVLIKT
jgi:RNA-directed DNA polymerase